MKTRLVGIWVLCVSCIVGVSVLLFGCKDTDLGGIERFHVGMTLQEFRAAVGRDYWGAPFATKTSNLTAEERAVAETYMLVVDEEWIVLTFNEDDRVIKIERDTHWADPKNSERLKAKHWKGPR